MSNFSKFYNLILRLLVAVMLSLFVISCSGGNGGSSAPSTSYLVNLDPNDGGFSNGSTNVAQNPIVVLLFSQTMDVDT